MCEVTPKQEAFLDGLMKGKSQRQAYLDAYPERAGWKKESLDISASRLLNDNAKVALRYQELQEEARAAAAISRDTIISELREIGFADIDLDRVSVKDKIKALELLVKILGYEQAQKVDMTLSEDSRVIKHLHLPFDGMEGDDGADR